MIHTEDITEAVEHDHKPARGRGRKRAAPRTKGRAKGAKPEERGRRTSGRVIRMLYGQSYGFIRDENRRDVFFHRKDAPALFNALNVDDRVVFELIEDAIAGPRAVHVVRADDVEATAPAR